MRSLSLLDSFLLRMTFTSHFLFFRGPRDSKLPAQKFALFATVHQKPRWKVYFLVRSTDWTVQ